MRRAKNAFLAVSLLALCTLPALTTGSCSAGNSSMFTATATSGPSSTGPGTGGTGTTTLSTGGGGLGIGGQLMLPDGGQGGAGGQGLMGDPTTCAEAAMYKTYIGCDFWPTPVANNVWSIFDFAAVVANAGTDVANITVTQNGHTITDTVQPNSLTTIYLPWIPALKGMDSDECGSAEPFPASIIAPGSAYHLVSSVPVTVFQFNALEYQGKAGEGPPGKDWSSCPGNSFCEDDFQAIGCYSFTNDASLLLPSTAMTGNYRVTGESGWYIPQPGGIAMGSYMAVTATQDNTMVTIGVAAGGQVVGGTGISATPGGQSLAFTLNAGDVAEVLGDAQHDLSGSLIHATNPVQVISGLPCTDIPSMAPACDHIESSVLPAETLGKHYFVPRVTGPGGSAVPQEVRIFGNVDGTTLTYPGTTPAGAPTTINAGQVVDLGQVNQDFEIVGSNEFAIGIFQLGASIVDPNDQPPNQQGDPSSSTAVTVEQYRTKYVFLAPIDYNVSYVDIIMPTTGANVMLDGAAITAAVSPISSGYGVARVQLTAGPMGDGAHVLTASMPVGIQVIGYGSYTSYQYPGGLNLSVISKAPPPPPPPQ